MSLRLASRRKRASPSRHKSRGARRPRELLGGVTNLLTLEETASPDGDATSIQSVTICAAQLALGFDAAVLNTDWTAFARVLIEAIAAKTTRTSNRAYSVKSQPLFFRPQTSKHLFHLSMFSQSIRAFRFPKAFSRLFTGQNFGEAAGAGGTGTWEELEASSRPQVQWTSEVQVAPEPGKN